MIVILRVFKEQLWTGVNFQSQQSSNNTISHSEFTFESIEHPWTLGKDGKYLKVVDRVIVDEYDNISSK